MVLWEVIVRKLKGNLAIPLKSCIWMAHDNSDTFWPCLRFSKWFRLGGDAPIILVFVLFFETLLAFQDLNVSSQLHLAETSCFSSAGQINSMTCLTIKKKKIRKKRNPPKQNHNIFGF